MEVNLAASDHQCSEYLVQGKKKPQITTIYPLRVLGAEGDIKLLSGCNLWVECECLSCVFSKAYKDKVRPRKA